MQTLVGCPPASISDEVDWYVLGPVLKLPCIFLLLITVGDWEACGDSFYSREVLYDPMQWEDMDLQTKR